MKRAITLVLICVFFGTLIGCGKTKVINGDQRSASPRTLKTKKSIFLVTFNTRYRLAATFLRFQEYYESPKFQGKVFSLEEYMDWYAEEKGKFSYFEDWSGFNIPSWVLEPFRAGEFNPLTKKEKAFLKVFKDRDDEFYIIGVSKEKGINIGTLRHEFVHGLFYTVPAYRSAVLREIRQHKIEQLRLWMARTGGYHEKVMDDEANAYLIASSKLPVPEDKSLVQARARLEDIFKKHFGFDVKNASEAFILGQIHELHL